jgi:hypothetical protein
MALLAAVGRTPLLLEHHDLVARLLLEHFGGNQRAGDGRAAGLGTAVAAKQQHLGELDDIAGLSRDLLDLDDVVGRHAILLAARANDREHGLIRLFWAWLPALWRGRSRSRKPRRRNIDTEADKSITAGRVRQTRHAVDFKLLRPFRLPFVWRQAT